MSKQKFLKRLKRPKPPPPPPPPVGEEALAMNLPFINDERIASIPSRVISLNDIDLDNIGSNFQIIREIEVEKIKETRFTKGKSKFLYYTIKPPTRLKTKTARKQPNNINTQLTANDRLSWKTLLVKNIQRTTKFIEKDLLPFTASISTAVLESEERFTQLIDDPQAKLPKGYFLKKANLAAQLMIIDHIVKTLNLSAENRKIMKVEFLRGLETPQLPKPTEIQQNGRKATKEKEDKEND